MNIQSFITFSSRLALGLTLCVTPVFANDDDDSTTSVSSARAAQRVIVKGIEKIDISGPLCVIVGGAAKEARIRPPEEGFDVGLLFPFELLSEVVKYAVLTPPTPNSTVEFDYSTFRGIALASRGLLRFMDDKCLRPRFFRLYPAEYMTGDSAFIHLSYRFEESPSYQVAKRALAKSLELDLTCSDGTAQLSGAVKHSWNPMKQMLRNIPLEVLRNEAFWEIIHAWMPRAEEQTSTLDDLFYPILRLLALYRDGFAEVHGYPDIDATKAIRLLEIESPAHYYGPYVGIETEGLCLFQSDCPEKSIRVLFEDGGRRMGGMGVICDDEAIRILSDFARHFPRPLFLESRENMCPKHCKALMMDIFDLDREVMAGVLRLGRLATNDFSHALCLASGLGEEYSADGGMYGEAGDALWNEFIAAIGGLVDPDLRVGFQECFTAPDS